MKSHANANANAKGVKLGKTDEEKDIGVTIT
jgi:hypothetical protein